MFINIGHTHNFLRPKLNNAHNTYSLGNNFFAFINIFGLTVDRIDNWNSNPIIRIKMGTVIKYEFILISLILTSLLSIVVDALIGASPLLLSSPLFYSVSSPP